MSELQYYHSIFEQINHMQTVTLNCLRSVGCQIVSVLTFLAGASAT